jgi:hypothetical protein
VDVLFEGCGTIGPSDKNGKEIGGRRAFRSESATKGE